MHSLDQGGLLWEGEKSFLTLLACLEMRVSPREVFFAKDGIITLFVASVFSGKIKGDSKALSGG